MQKLSNKQSGSVIFRPVRLIKTSGSESWPRKVELMRVHSKNVTTTGSILHITMEIVFIPTKTNLTALIFIS